MDTQKENTGIEILTAPEWKKTFMSMEVNQFFETDFKREVWMRTLASTTKSETGRRYAVNRTATGIKVTRIL